MIATVSKLVMLVSKLDWSFVMPAYRPFLSPQCSWNLKARQGPQVSVVESRSLLVLSDQQYAMIDETIYWNPREGWRNNVSDGRTVDLSKMRFRTNPLWLAMTLHL